jgi:hypothetical protein
MGRRPFRFVRSDIPLLLSSDILAIAVNCCLIRRRRTCQTARLFETCGWNGSMAVMSCNAGDDYRVLMSTGAELRTLNDLVEKQKEKNES